MRLPMYDAQKDRKYCFKSPDRTLQSSEMNLQKATQHIHVHSTITCNLGVGCIVTILATMDADRIICLFDFFIYIDHMYPAVIRVLLLVWMN